MNVAIFSDSYLPVLNGVSVSVHTLVAGLRARGHRVWVFAPAFPGHRDTDPDVVRFRSLITPWAKGYPLARPPFRGTLRRFQRLPIEIVHTHTPFTIGFCGLRWAESAGIPILSTYHTMYDRYVHYVPFFTRRYVAYKVAKHTRYYYGRVARVITPSHAAADVLRGHGVTTPIEVVRTGIPQAKAIPKSEARDRLGIPQDESTLLYVGRLASEKNLGLLLDCLPRWRTSFPNARLRLVGDGPGRPLLESRAAELGIRERLTVHGQVGHDEVLVYMAAADLFVFPSTSETQGLVIGEAQSLGLPAVAVRGGGAPETIEHGVDGMVVADDAQEFAQAVEEILRDPVLRAKMSENALRSPARISPDEYVGRIERLYEEVLGERQQETPTQPASVHS
ncbi:MAG: glycosyltransferase family 4 protein [Fimbriimonadia bacterium]